MKPTSDRLEYLEFEKGVERQFLNDTLNMMLDYQCPINEQDFSRVRNLIVEIRGYGKAIAEEKEKLENE